MTDADKILQALAGLQHTVEKQGKSVEALHKGQKSLQDGQKTFQATVERQGKQLTALQDTVENQSKAIAVLQEGQKALQAGQQTLELKVEAFHAEQKQANDELIRIFHNIEEINHKEIEKRVERIERHLNLPPLK
jgi:uncharacterized phage infection (PIP) family protein YhgE